MNKRTKWKAAVAAGVVLLAQAAGGIAAAHPACPADGDCCVGNGTPGCDNEDCCNLICDTLDPFCCDSYWDNLCASTALSQCCICGCGCPLVCPPGALDEGEPCLVDDDIDTINGGCDSIPPVFSNASCGDKVCGLISTYLATGGVQSRDTDWYLVEHPGGTIQAILASELPAVCLILDGIDTCTPVVVGDIGCGMDTYSLEVASATLPAGMYVVFVAPGLCDGTGIFAGGPCGGGNNYVLRIECIPCIGDCEATPDGIVGIADFLTLLAQWGTTGTCDVDGDGVGITDFLEMLAHWGPCE
jgi:hypothetical protein